MRIPSSREVEFYRSKYPAGTRICCDCMPDDPRPVKSGTMGTVVCVDDMCNILMKWDNGSSLSLVPGHDSFHVVSQEEEMEAEMQQEEMELS